MISVVYSFRLVSNDKIRPITLPAINTHQQILISCKAKKENRDIPKGNVKEKIKTTENINDVIDYINKGYRLGIMISKEIVEDIRK